MSYKNIPCKVFAPATVANVAVGYDILGFAIEGLGDEVIVKKGTKKGLCISLIRGSKSLSKDIMQNTAGFSAYKLLESLDLVDEPIELVLNKNMPLGTGMGSSAASAVAGVFAVNEYLGRPYSRKELLPFATMGEELADGSWHADNVAPSLLGGFVGIRDNATLDVFSIPSIPGLKAVVIYPHIKILTKDSREILSDKIKLSDFVKQSGQLAGFISGMYTSNLELVQRSLSDLIIEPQRAHLIPGFSEIKEAALNENVLGFSISGAGPSMFGLCQNSVIAENVVEKAEAIYNKIGIKCTCYISNINLEGAKKY